MSEKRGWKRSAGAFAAVGVVMALLLPSALATTQSNNPRQKFRSGNTVTIPAEETVPHDLYVSGVRSASPAVSKATSSPQVAPSMFRVP
jgi:hypothetical protein